MASTVPPEYVLLPLKTPYVVPMSRMEPVPEIMPLKVTASEATLVLPYTFRLLDRLTLPLIVIVPAALGAR